MGAVETCRRPSRDSKEGAAPSIRPRHGSRGDHACYSLAILGAIAFNSATAWEPWRRRNASSRRAAANTLQFGHGMGAVETSAVAATYAPSLAPSIRPRHGSRGDAGEISQAIDARSLQFGHGMGAVETENDLTNPSAAAFLQFGHGMGAVETRNQPSRFLAKHLPSIRPRHGSRGDS